MISNYTTLLFDLDDTLLDFYKSEARAVCDALQRNGITPAPETAALYSEINRGFWDRFERGEIEKSEIFDNRFAVLLDRIGKKGDVPKISFEYREALALGFDLLDGAVEILTYLKSAGYKIYTASNGIAGTQQKRLCGAGIDGFFDGVFVSETCGCQKPQKGFYEYIFKHIPESRRECILMIGDSQNTDILGAVNAGIDSCYINRRNKPNKYHSKFEVASLYGLKEFL